ncbi:MAG: S-adenosylmethionine:tRNA ribosyltransferase-isomerase [Ferruginibacter sp.]
MNPRQISISEYDYELPEGRIAMHPPETRDASKMLVYRNGEITATAFLKIADHLPSETLLVFNDTKVINARIKFKKESGAGIEIFCLEPAGTVKEYNSIMNATGTADWKCLVGGASKWKEDKLEKQILIGEEKAVLYAEKNEQLSDSYIIRLSWLPASFTFAEVAEAAGNVPLPPYIKRNTEEADSARYQTVFAKQRGSVAAPTAGLHFSARIFERLSEKNIEKDFLTLHVGAGTFKPVKAETMAEHEMHAEYIDVSLTTVENIRKHLGSITAVGTTSLRTLESLYWMGVKTILTPGLPGISLGQWEVYEGKLSNAGISADKALESLGNWMRRTGKENIFTQTRIIIAPGYIFRVVNILVTNFHQPRSTLLLLVAAAIGEDWKKMYEYAMENDFRFLSYGDANLIFINSR